ncbi:unnamed protein product, partial [Iphiclides podalirius]
MLRGLTPPHRVKSISMATFTPEEIEFIKARGNDYCRRVWLALTNMTAAPASTPPISAPISDFPVDFSTANIYNSAQYNNNNFVSHPSSALTNFNSFNTSNLSTTSTNDRYAALADLDLALRQQNMKNMEESSNTNSKNPFQSTTTNDLFSNKNPFFISGWNSTTAMPVNPFMPSSNPTLGNSKNPFL